MTASASAADFTATIDRVQGDDVVIGVPGNAYGIRVGWAGDTVAATGRVRGVIEAHALRVHPAAAGGRFIEPVMGAPRIVSGTVTAIDVDAATVAVRSVVPMHLALAHREDLAACEVGASVNFHVRSDSRFVPEC